jgi:hypothetical protein
MNYILRALRLNFNPVKTKWATFLSSAPTPPGKYRKQHYFFKVPRVCSFLLLVRATCGWRWVWSSLHYTVHGNLFHTSLRTIVCFYYKYTVWTCYWVISVKPSGTCTNKMLENNDPPVGGPCSSVGHISVMLPHQQGQLQGLMKFACIVKFNQHHLCCNRLHP